MRGHVSDISPGDVTVDREPGKEGPDNKVVAEASSKVAMAKTEKRRTAGPPVAPGTHAEATKQMSRWTP